MHAKQQAHLTAATEARKYMNDCIARAKELLEESMELGRRPLQPPTVGHYSFDYAQQICELIVTKRDCCKWIANAYVVFVLAYQ